MRLPIALSFILCLAVSSAAHAQMLDAPPGAAACSGCHTNSASVDTPAPRINSAKADYIIQEMLAFKSGERHGTIMDRIAKGFSDDEIRAIANWYAARKD